MIDWNNSWGKLDDEPSLEKGECRYFNRRKFNKFCGLKFECKEISKIKKRNILIFLIFLLKISSLVNKLVLN